MTTVVPLKGNTFPLNHGQVTSIFIPSPEKDVTKCTNNCTNALFPNANKMHLRKKKKQLNIKDMKHRQNKQDQEMGMGQGTKSPM
jgi:hypothetical protein